jgi:5-methylcytosine-specific restriction protein A
MPTAPLRYCLGRGCGNTVARGYCPQCQPQADRGVHYGRRWGKARLAYLADHPFCVDCEREGKQTLATDVDHIIPHKGNTDRFWDSTGWAALCKSHHSKKTRAEQLA